MKRSARLGTALTSNFMIYLFSVAVHRVGHVCTVLQQVPMCNVRV